MAEIDQEIPATEPTVPEGVPSPDPTPVAEGSELEKSEEPLVTDNTEETAPVEAEDTTAAVPKEEPIEEKIKQEPGVLEDIDVEMKDVDKPAIKSETERDVSTEGTNTPGVALESQSTTEVGLNSPAIAAAETPEAQVPQVQTIPLSELKKQTHTIVLPSYTSWFNMAKINKIEKESLPEFFNHANRNKTPQIYLKYRNFMINSYRLNPNDYLSFTAVRRNLVGDAPTILRVHRFLDKWGLINYQVNPETKPVPVQPPYTGDFTADYDTPRGMFPFESYKPPVQLPDLSKVKKLLANGDEPSETAGLNDLPLEGENTENEPPKKKIKIVKPDINKGWTEEALATLLQAIKECHGDWFKIAEKVGDKTPEQCVIRFLQLPMEDPFLEKHKELLGPLKYIPNLSFSANDNPVMSTLAFLSRMVDPEVAAAASNRAIKAIDERIVEKLNEVSKAKAEKEKEKDKEKEKQNEKDEKSEEKKEDEGEETKEESTEEGKEDEIKDESAQIEETADVEMETEDNVEESTEDSDPLADIKDAAVNSFGIIGAKSHMFATFEEREMNRAFMNILQNELKVVGLKLKKLKSLEKEYDMERRRLSRENDDLFLEKLSLFKYTNIASSKLLQAIELLTGAIPEDSDADTVKLSGQDVEKLRKLVSDAKGIVLRPPRKQLNILETTTEEEQTEAKEEEGVNPVSLEAPQLYRYWSG